MKTSTKIFLASLTFILSTGCQKSFLKYLELKRTVSPINPIALPISTTDDLTQSPETPAPELSLTNCVHVFYDKTPPVGYQSLGKIYAIQVLNLLGHFAEYQRHLSTVEDYKAGDINKCSVNILIDTNYYTELPATFIQDFITTTTQVAWVGSNSWKLGSALKSIFGVEYNNSVPYTVLDTTNLVDDKPSFYKNIYYKGEKFYKYGQYGKRDPYLNDFFAAYEIANFEYNISNVNDTTDHAVLAEIEHNFTLDKNPWALQSKNKFLFSEIPLSFAHTADRYLIFADLLFDILKAEPRHNSKPSVIRLEDVHSEVAIQSLERARLIFKENNVKPHISIIPIYNNPANPLEVYMGEGERPMTLNTNFIAKINEFKTDGAEFIWHGITHQLGTAPNPWEATSGSDYEFWDFSEDVQTNHPWPLVGRPVPNETPQSLTTLFKKGADILKTANIFPDVWLTPHYHGSSMSNYVFGQLFNWNIGRVVYYENNMTGLNLDAHDPKMKFPNMSEDAWKRRDFYLKNLAVEQNTRQNGQFFPYEIYGDVYGQKLFPENIGNIGKELGEQVLETREVPQILEDAKRNLVLRDTWASAFYHPYYLVAPYWTSTSTIQNNDLNDLLVGLKNLGYTFVSLEQKSKEWVTRSKKVVYH